ncbi:hypothetical protein OF83DRAFT_1175490 [Amylostereum chailletii]|nr:hypothetical protein OF83DRAFT_1175490 [Amylostereum chailletii]
MDPASPPPLPFAAINVLNAGTIIIVNTDVVIAFNTCALSALNDGVRVTLNGHIAVAVTLNSHVTITPHAPLPSTTDPCHLTVLNIRILIAPTVTLPRILSLRPSTPAPPSPRCPCPTPLRATTTSFLDTLNTNAPIVFDACTSIIVLNARAPATPTPTRLSPPTPPKSTSLSWSMPTPTSPLSAVADTLITCNLNAHALAAHNNHAPSSLARMPLSPPERPTDGLVVNADGLITPMQTLSSPPCQRPLRRQCQCPSTPHQRPRHQCQHLSHPQRPWPQQPQDCFWVARNGHVTVALNASAPIALTAVLVPSPSISAPSPRSTLTLSRAQHPRCHCA